MGQLDESGLFEDFFLFFGGVKGFEGGFFQLLQIGQEVVNPNAVREEYVLKILIERGKGLQEPCKAECCEFLQPPPGSSGSC